MAVIIPRWEWRTFGETFAEADGRFTALAPEKIEESDEVYVLSPVADGNVKIRDGLMDVKLRQHVNADGLEQWMPAMKGAFPLPAADVEKVLGALGVAPSPLARAQYTLAQFISELVEAGGRLRTAQVHKRRARYRVSGCLAEMTEVMAAGMRTRTVAIESEDPARVIAAVRALGLDRFQNLSYPRGLRQLLGMKP